MINSAMIFAAGKGVRMMPLTANRPKPMIEVDGQPLLGHALGHVRAAGVRNVVINAHHCPQVIESWLPPDIRLSREDELLETGGGVKKALQNGLLPANAPFFGINADILCTDGPQQSALTRLQNRWAQLDDAVDVLLLLIPKEKAWGHDSPKGDYRLGSEGRIVRLSNPEADYIYAGLQITRPHLYQAADLGTRFSNLEIFDRAQAAGRLFGLVHDGGWFHFSTPQSLELYARRALEPLA